MGNTRQLTEAEIRAYADLAAAARRLEEAKSQAEAEAARRRETADGVILSLDRLDRPDRKGGARGK
jgi:hypothetical protein